MGDKIPSINGRINKMSLRLIRKLEDVVELQQEIMAEVKLLSEKEEYKNVCKLYLEGMMSDNGLLQVLWRLQKPI